MSNEVTKEEIEASGTVIVDEFVTRMRANGRTSMICNAVVPEGVTGDAAIGFVHERLRAIGYEAMAVSIRSVNWEQKDDAGRTVVKVPARDFVFLVTKQNLISMH